MVEILNVVVRVVEVVVELPPIHRIVQVIKHALVDTPLGVEGAMAAYVVDATIAIAKLIVHILIQFKFAYLN